MCAVVDASVADQVFGRNRPEAGVEFFEWIKKGRGRLVAGGKLLEELNRTSARDWAREAVNAGRIRKVNNAEVDEMTEELRDSCNSDDPHVLALALISGARLLYSNDKNLIQDFKTKSLIDQPRGKVYSTLESEGRFQDSHKKLLRKKELCRSEQ